VALDAMREIHFVSESKRFVIRDAPPGDAGKALQAPGVALRPKIRRQEAS
jgi:hypothetical protein